MLVQTCRMTRTRHGLIFDEAPTLYDRYRPTYPAAAVDDLLALAGARPGDEVLEIGAGTGQLTRALLDHGLRVTALEPGPRTARVLARRLQRWPGVEIIVARLEDAPLGGQSFDLVASATAFHWVDPGRRMDLAADRLRPGGTLALLRNDNIAGPGNERYFQLAHDVYRREAPELAWAREIPSDTRTPWFGPEIAASGRFELIEERAYPWHRPTDSRSLVGLLRTYSDHRALPTARRARLLRGLAAVVNDDLGGGFTDHFITSLSVARRT
jgi:SAM-dependent methyltransferase